MSVELNLWIMPVRRRSVRRLLEKIIHPFHRDNPYISVRILVIPWSTVWDRLMSGLKGRHGGPAPDVLQVDMTWTATLAYLGLLRDIPALGRDEVPASLRAACSLPGDDRRFAEPWTMDLRALFYRRAAVEDSGVAESDLSSWDGVRDLSCRAASLRRPLFRPRPGGEGLLAELAPWVWAAGGDFFSDDHRRPMFTQPEALRGFAFYRDILITSVDGRGDPFLETDSVGGVVPAPMRAIPLPRGTAGRFTATAGNALAVASGTRHIRESLLLLRFLCSTPARRMFAAEAGLLPPEAPTAPLAAACFDGARAFPSMSLLGSFERLFFRRISPLVRAPSSWDDWHAALDRTSQETEILLSHYDPAHS